jgi:hypothetical protein
VLSLVRCAWSAWDPSLAAGACDWLQANALKHVAPMLLGVVTLDPDAPGETHSPLDFAPRPASLARGLFDDAVISAHLDHLAAAQHGDGGWTFNWPTWSPAAEQDWRGYITVSSLVILQANGRARP